MAGFKPDNYGRLVLRRKEVIRRKVNYLKGNVDAKNNSKMKIKEQDHENH